MLRSLLDLGSSAQGASIIFRKGLQLQKHDLLRSHLPQSLIRTDSLREPAPSRTQDSGIIQLARTGNTCRSPAGFVPDLSASSQKLAGGPTRSPQTSRRPTPSHSALSLGEDIITPQAVPDVGGSRHLLVERRSDTPSRSQPVLDAIPRPTSPLAAPAPETINVSPSFTSKVAVPEAGNSFDRIERELEQVAGGVSPDSTAAMEDPDQIVTVLRASRVPSSRIGRLFHYGSLATSLSLGAAAEAFRRTASGSSSSSGSLLLSEGNINRLVDKLGQMRGAALKLGQFLSIQDSGTLPPELERVLRRVQAGADYMPDWQLQKVLSAELGSDWRSRFIDFSPTPMASASIGQVHAATIEDPASSTPIPVAVKVQFPGVSSSISSDLANLSLLLRSSALLPRGLFLENTLRVMRGELEDECNYVREAECARRFGTVLGTGTPGQPGHVEGGFRVPKIFDNLSSDKVLTMEMMSGKPLSRLFNLDQDLKDSLGTNLLRLCLRELFELRLMQTDPNWSNFLYNEKTRQIELIDFGATREYSKAFMNDWFRLLDASVSGDKAAMHESSLKLGYLTGEENPEMLAAHLESMSLLGTPFRPSVDGKPFDFSNQTITDQVKALIPVMLKHRLTPPPEETYSLNRKLSGAFLLCARLGSQVQCADLWREVTENYRFEE